MKPSKIAKNLPVGIRERMVIDMSGSCGVEEEQGSARPVLTLPPPGFCLVEPPRESVDPNDLFEVVPQIKLPGAIVSVSRAVPPVYPKVVSGPVYPGLEATGPSKFNLNTVERILHVDQQLDRVQGIVILECLEKANVLSSCLNLQDGLAIKEKDPRVFRRFFGGYKVFLWASAAWSVYGFGGKWAPFLFEDKNEMMIGWERLVNYLGLSDVAAVFNHAQPLLPFEGG